MDSPYPFLNFCSVPESLLFVIPNVLVKPSDSVYSSEKWGNMTNLTEFSGH